MQQARPVVLAALVTMLAGCFEGSPPPRAQLPASEAVLAKERQVRIGGATVYLPTLLLLSSTSNASIVMAPSNPRRPHSGFVPMDRLLSDPLFPMGAESNVGAVEVSLDRLQLLQDSDTDTHVGTTRVCPRLPRPWQRDVCASGLIDGRHVFSPRSFTLIDEDYLFRHRPQMAGYAGRWRSVGEAARASVAQWRSDRPIAHCEVSATGERNNLCTVVARIDGNMLAVWSTDRSDAETASELERQVSRLRCLVSQGMGPSAGVVTACLGWPPEDQRLKQRAE